MTRFFQFRVKDGEGEFDAFEEVALHPVGAGEIDVFLAAGVEVHDAVMFKKAPDDRADAMFSDKPRSRRSKRTNATNIRSIITPACEASYRALMTSGSTSEFILATIRPLPPRRAASASA
jgi:hypothetical protein